MNILSRYLVRYVFVGFAAAAGLLLPLFTTFNLINELDDVSSGGYRWTQAVMFVLLTLPRCLIDLGPFIALLGGIVGLGLLAKNLELTAIRSMGFSIFRIALVVLVGGLLWAVVLGVTDEWLASPLQQKALQMKNTAEAQEEGAEVTGNILWARRGNEFATVKTLDEQGQPQGVEIFRYRDDLTLESYLYAASATIGKGNEWTLHYVQQKTWSKGRETVETKQTLAWQPIFTDMSLQELSMPGDSFSVRQLTHYLDYLQNTGQPSLEFKLALWQKFGRPVLTLAMILLAIPFTFSAPRSTGMGSRLAIGVVVGLLTYISYQIIINLGLLLSLNVQLTALGLPSLYLIIALGLVYHFDRQH